MENTKVQYIKVPSTGDIFAKVDDLIVWASVVKSQDPSLGEVCDIFAGRLRNLVTKANATDANIAAKITVKPPSGTLPPTV